MSNNTRMEKTEFERARTVPEEHDLNSLLEKLLIIHQYPRGSEEVLDIELNSLGEPIKHLKRM